MFLRQFPSNTQYLAKIGKTNFYKNCSFVFMWTQKDSKSSSYDLSFVRKCLHKVLAQNFYYSFVRFSSSDVTIRKNYCRILRENVLLSPKSAYLFPNSCSMLRNTGNKILFSATSNIQEYGEEALALAKSLKSLFFSVQSPLGPYVLRLPNTIIGKITLFHFPTYSQI